MRRFSAAVQAALKSRLFYPIVFVSCALPAASLLWRVWQAAFGDQPDALGVNPVETLLHATGRDALGLLLITLTVTPIRRLTGWNRVQIVRRTLGVWSFTYALAHLSIYFIFDQVGDIHAVIADVTERKFIFVGMFTFTILLALAVTSTKGMMHRLGRNWQRLHRLVYVAGIAGVIHFAWGQKADIREPLEWAAFLALLLGIRVYYAWRKRSATSFSRAPQPAPHR